MQQQILGLAICVNLVFALLAGWATATAPLSIGTLIEEPPARARGSAQHRGGQPGSHVPVADAAGEGEGVAAPGPRPLSAVQKRAYAAEVGKRVSLPPGVRVTTRQVEGVSQAICQGFDEGYSVAQVRTGLQAAGSRYELNVSDQDASFAISGAVSGSCPTYVDLL